MEKPSVEPQAGVQLPSIRAKALKRGQLPPPIFEKSHLRCPAKDGAGEVGGEKSRGAAETAAKS